MGLPVQVRAALAAAAGGAVLCMAGSVAPVVDGAAPGFLSWPVLMLVAAAPVVLAALLAVRGHRVWSAGVLVGAAALAPGQILVDLQFAVDAAQTSRPELYLADSLAAPAPAIGLWLLLAGQIALSVAGVLAWQGCQLDIDLGATREGGRRWLPAAMGAALLAGVGLMMAPFGSTDIYLLARGALDGPALILVGSGLLACAVPLVVALALTSGVSELAGGALLGLALGVLAVSAPDLNAVLALPEASFSTGPALALLGALGLAVLGLAPFDPGAAGRSEDEHSRGANLPGYRRLIVVVAVLSVGSGGCAVLGSLTPLVTGPGGVTAAESPTRWLLLAAGCVLVALGAGLLLPGVSPLRPALSIAWAGVTLAGSSVLDTAVGAVRLGGIAQAGPGVLTDTVEHGPGVAWTLVAMFGALAAGCVSLVAGIVEREDTEEARGVGGTMVSRTSAPVGAVLAVAAGLAIAGLVLPVATAEGYAAPDLWSNFETPSWGLLVAGAVVLGVTVLAPFGRPARSAVLLLAAAGVLALHAGKLPFTAGAVQGVTAGAGWWCTLGAIVTFLVAAVVAGSAGRPGAASHIAESSGQSRE